jgi:hypothetical protein
MGGGATFFDNLVQIRRAPDAEAAGSPITGP